MQSLPLAEESAPLPLMQSGLCEKPDKIAQPTSVVILCMVGQRLGKSGSGLRMWGERALPVYKKNIKI